MFLGAFVFFPFPFPLPEEGTTDGVDEGDTLASFDGADDGEVLGILLGSDDGVLDGERYGSDDGTSLGTSLGCKLLLVLWRLELEAVVQSSSASISDGRSSCK